MVQKKLFKEFQDGCLVHQHFWYVNGMILAIPSLHVAWRIPASFCLKQYIGWKMLFEENQDGCLVLISEWNDFIYSESPWSIPISFCSREIWVGRSRLKSYLLPRRLFSAWPSFVSEWNERSISKSLFGLTHPIKFLLMRRSGLEQDVVWRISRPLFKFLAILISE